MTLRNTRWIGFHLLGSKYLLPLRGFPIAAHGVVWLGPRELRPWHRRYFSWAFALVDPSHIAPRYNPTLCKIVPTSGEVPGSHFDRAVNLPHWILIKRISFELNSVSQYQCYYIWFIIILSFWKATVGYFEWLPFHKNWVWFNGNRLRNGGFAGKFLKTKTDKLLIDTGICKACLFYVLCDIISEKYSCEFLYFGLNSLENCWLAIILFRWKKSDRHGKVSLFVWSQN